MRQTSACPRTKPAMAGRCRGRWRGWCRGAASASSNRPSRPCGPSRRACRRRRPGVTTRSEKMPRSACPPDHRPCRNVPIQAIALADEVADGASACRQSAVRAAEPLEQGPPCSTRQLLQAGPHSSAAGRRRPRAAGPSSGTSSIRARMKTSDEEDQDDEAGAEAPEADPLQPVGQRDRAGRRAQSRRRTAAGCCGRRRAKAPRRQAPRARKSPAAGASSSHTFRLILRGDAALRGNPAPR